MILQSKSNGAKNVGLKSQPTFNAKVLSTDTLASGERHYNTRIGRPEEWALLAPLLETRASALLEWANDDSLWEDIHRPLR